jgi:hypothetical protein
MKDGKNKPEKAIQLTDRATSVLFPVRETYDSKNNVTNDPEDFIYFTRDIEDSDGERTGNVVEVMRPNGSENFSTLMTGKEVTLESVRGGGLFYKTTQSAYQVFMFTNLHDDFLNTTTEGGKPNSPSYAAYEASKSATSTVEGEAKRSNINVEVYKAASLDDYTSRYFGRSSVYFNGAYIIGFTASAAWYLTNAGESVKIINEAVTFQGVYGDYVYYTKSDGILYRTRYAVSYEDKSESDYEQISHKELYATAPFKPDFVAGYAFYMSKLDEFDLTAYGFLISINRAGADAVSVHVRAASDAKPEETEATTTPAAEG